jgi:hypothetical protein
MPMYLRSLAFKDLKRFEGRGPGFFCDTALVTPHQNHCAHFVCHAIDLKIGRPLCGDMKFATRHTGVTMRVNDVFNYCTVTGHFAKDGEIPDAVKGFNAFFIVATIAANVFATNGMIMIHDNPKKHIGICINNKVWNFSNGHHVVVCDEMKAFFFKMRRAYGQHTTFLYAYRQDI